jgi:toxin ParE1/3/4
MPRVTLRPLAQNDLLKIWSFIARDNVPLADRWADQIDAGFQSLAGQPGMGRSREELADGLRSFALGRYDVFYVALIDGIDVVRVLHGSRDIASELNQEP